MVQFYAAQRELQQAAGPFLGTALAAGGTAIVIATEEHRAAFVDHLSAAGIDTGAAQADGRLVLLDARATLDGLMDDDHPQADRLKAVVGGLMAGAPNPLHAYGEMVALLWDDGQVNAALELEEQWNDLGRVLPFSLWCAYPTSMADAGGEAVTAVCTRHSRVHGEVPAPHPDATQVVRRSPSFPAARTSPAAARRFVAQALQGWADESLTASAVLAVSELATNAVVHAASSFTVVLAWGPTTLRVGVHDDSPTRPTRRTADVRADSGRGLELVGALATRWEVESDGDGKVVWVELARPLPLA